MKKRNEWLTKRIKRRFRKRKDKGVVDFIKIVRHFFKELPHRIEEIIDPRNESYITYSQSDLIHLALMKNVCSVETMHQMDEMFNEETCIQTLSILSGNESLEEIPHCDTLNYYLEKLSPECLSELRRKMVRKLLRTNQFNDARLLGKHWRIILDGTGLYSFRERHCAHCLKATYTDEDGNKTTYYYHKVLEAKLVLSDGFVISLGTEFIENEDENVSKQDCELRAAERLLKRIKKDYPRLNICVQGDALYETEPFMKLCAGYGWRYLLVHKDERQPTVGSDYNLLDDEDKIRRNGVGKEYGTAEYRNGMQETSGKKAAMNIFAYRAEQNGETKTFQWCTDIPLSTKNIGEMVDAGRGRWNIENEGFNNQKNILYKIEHLNSHHPTAMKNHYLLTQIADILMQLYLHWNPMVKKLKQGIKNTSSRLLESFRQHTITEEDVSYIKRRTSVYLE